MDRQLALTARAGEGHFRCLTHASPGAESARPRFAGLLDDGGLLLHHARDAAAAPAVEEVKLRAVGKWTDRVLRAAEAIMKIAGILWG